MSDADKVIEVLKKYDLEKKADAEFERKKLSKTPYDYEGFYEICHGFLIQKKSEINEEKKSLQNIHCEKIAGMPNEWKYTDERCLSIQSNSTISKTYCELQCEYYKDNIKVLESQMAAVQKFRI